MGDVYKSSCAMLLQLKTGLGAEAQRMFEFAITVFGISGFAAIACWGLASAKKSKRWTWLAVAFAAIAGFSLCPAMSGNIALPRDVWLLSIGMAALAAIGMKLTMWWIDYLQTSASRDTDKLSKPLAIASATVLATLGMAIVAGWIYLQKRVFRKQ